MLLCGNQGDLTGGAALQKWIWKWRLVMWGTMLLHSTLARREGGREGQTCGQHWTTVVSKLCKQTHIMANHTCCEDKHISCPIYSLHDTLDKMLSGKYHKFWHLNWFPHFSEIRFKPMYSRRVNLLTWCMEQASNQVVLLSLEIVLNAHCSNNMPESVHIWIHHQQHFEWQNPCSQWLIKHLQKLYIVAKSNI